MTQATLQDAMFGIVDASASPLADEVRARINVTAGWTDLGLESQQAGRAEAVPGVLYRSPCTGWHVGVDDLRKPAARRRWVVWDVRHGQQRQALMGCAFSTRDDAIEAADILRGSMARRLSSGLASVLRAHLRSLLGSVRAVLAAEVET